MHARPRRGAAHPVARRLHTVIGDERGQTLAMVLVCVAALTAATAALSSLVVSNTKAFGRDRQQARAFNVAEAGVSYGVSRLTKFDPNGALAVGSTIGSVDVPQTFTLDGATGNGGWWAEKIGANVWSVHSRAVSPNGGVSREIAVRAMTDTTTTNVQASAAWGYGLFVASPSGCTTVVGNSPVTMPVFIKSDLCFQGTSGVLEPSLSGPKRVTLYVGGKVTTSGNATVGTAGRPIVSAAIVGGCNGGAPAICSNSTYSRVYADAYSSSPSSLTKPPLYLEDTYGLANWSNRTCSKGSFTFDNDSTMNRSVGSFTLFGGSYECVVKNSNGDEVGRLVWDITKRELKVGGILFVDGDLDLAGGSQATYTGTGALYVNGSVSTQGNSAICGPGTTLAGSSCSGLWDATQGALGIVAVNGWRMTGTAEFNVLAYVVGNYDDGGGAKVTGPIITDTASVHGTPDTTDDSNPPPGMPGAAGYTSTTTWSIVNGTWRELPVQ